MTHSRLTKSVALLAAFCASVSLARAQYIGPESGQKVAFMGDSITFWGAAHPAGFVILIGKALDQQGKKVELINAGVSGQTTAGMLGRMNSDVLSKKVDWMVLAGGVNDVWGTGPNPDAGTLANFKKNVTSMVDLDKTAGIKVLLTTPTPIKEDYNNGFNHKIVPYVEFVRETARERNLPLADLNADLHTVHAQILAENPNIKGNLLTMDGIHMNGLGDQVMAAGILKAWGFTDAQLAQAKALWTTLPGAMQGEYHSNISVQQYMSLLAAANSQNTSVSDLLNKSLNKDVDALIPGGASSKP